MGIFTDGKSLNLKQENIKNLKSLFPEAFTENQIYWEKLKATLGEIKTMAGLWIKRVIRNPLKG